MITGDWACFSLQGSHRLCSLGWDPMAQLISCSSRKLAVVRVALCLFVILVFHIDEER